MTAMFINGDDGRWVLADSEQEARDFALTDDPDIVLTPDGWMQNVGWDRDHYELKRDFVHDTGFASWWESATPPAGGRPGRYYKMAFAVSYAPASTREQKP
jgi:hypothetical protein